MDDNVETFWNDPLKWMTPDEEEIFELARGIEKELHALGIGNGCQAILSDDDIAVCLKNYINSDHLGSISGTPELTSKSLRQAIQLQEAYVQNSADDMESFLWIAMWAMLLNMKVPATTPAERMWQAGLPKKLISGRRF